MGKEREGENEGGNKGKREMGKEREEGTKLGSQGKRKRGVKRGGKEAVI